MGASGVTGETSRRAGFLGGLRQSDTPEGGTDAGFGSGTLIGGAPFIRLGDPGDPNAGRYENGFNASPGSNTPPGFDPIWGTLGPPTSQGDSDWRSQDEEQVEGLKVDVEIFGHGFQISGQIQTGQFDRLLDWFNIHSGFIAIRDPRLGELGQLGQLGQAEAPDLDQRKGTLWVRVDQIVLVAERSPSGHKRPGAPVVPKQRRKVSMVTPGYNLQGSVYVHDSGSMAQFLESPDPHFLPMTDLTVRSLTDAAMVARFPFAMVNREQLVTVLDESTSPADDSADPEVLHRVAAVR